MSEYSKDSQLKKTKSINLKKLTKIENKLFHDYIIDKTLSICKLCNERGGDDFHHAKYGTFGADKDDTCQVLSCRKCHDLCHVDKHGIVNTLAVLMGDSNWRGYNE